MQILIAKCIDNQQFLISILPSGLLILLEGKNAVQSAFLIVNFTLTKQQSSESAF